MNYLIYLILFHFLTIMPVFGANVPFFYYTGEHIEFIPEARAFRGNIGGIKVSCLDVGPLHGTPLQLEGGIGLTIVYLRKFIRSLNEKNFRVFSCNRPGQGSGVLYSGLDTPESDLGIDGMLKVFPALRNFAYQTTGGKKVVVAGHSLGGIAVRAGSVGLEFDSEGAAYISKRAAQIARKQTALVVPLFTLALTGEQVIASSSAFKLMYLKDVLPFVANCFESFHSCMPTAVTGIMDKFISSYVLHSQNAAHQDLFGVVDIDRDELSQLGRFILPQRVSHQLVSHDAYRWQQDQAYTTNSHFDFGDHFYKIQMSSQALPMLAFIGEKDTFTSHEAFIAEATNFQNTQIYRVSAGHMGAFFSHALSDKLALIIRRAHDLKNKQATCQKWLRIDLATAY